MKKIIVSDFDDTIYVNGKIATNDLARIHDFRENNNIFVIASGSSFDSIKRKLNNQNLEYDYLITNHGSTILKNDKIIHTKTIPLEILTKICETFKIENKDKWNKESGKGYFFSSTTKGLLYNIDKNVTKIHLDFPSKSALDKAVKRLNTRFNNEINCYELLYNNDIEIISKKASKLIAIEMIRKLENVDKNNVYTIGDGNSDVEMIKTYKGYSVKNAIKELKKVSIKTVESVSELISEVSDE